MLQQKNKIVVQACGYLAFHLRENNGVIINVVSSRGPEGSLGRSTIIFIDELMTRIDYGIYELPHELPNELTLRVLGNIRKVSKLHIMINFSRSALFYLKNRVSLKYLVSYCRYPDVT